MAQVHFEYFLRGYPPPGLLFEARGRRQAHQAAQKRLFVDFGFGFFPFIGVSLNFSIVSLVGAFQ